MSLPKGLETLARRLNRPVIFWMAALIIMPLGLAGAGDWTNILEDGIHDPANEASAFLQNPHDSLSKFPSASLGNKVDWVKALDDGLLDPRFYQEGGANFEIINPNDERASAAIKKRTFRAVDFDIIMENTGTMPFVRFPHLAHTKWLTCVNCHPRIFLPQKNSNPITMSGITQGKFCGVCHGKVAFPPLDCMRCHSVPRKASSKLR